MVPPLLLPAASPGDPRSGRAVLRRSRRRGLRALLRILEERGRSLSARLHADRRAPQESPLGRARAQFPAVPARPLCRVQPALRPRYIVRAAVARPHRVDLHVHASARALGLRLAAATRIAGGTAVCGFPAAQGLPRRTRARAMKRHALRIRDAPRARRWACADGPWLMLWVDALGDYRARRSWVTVAICAISCSCGRSRNI